MTGHDFLPVATALSQGATEPEWRSAVSRAYYAAFHVARQLLLDLGFVVPRSDRIHRYPTFRLSNCGNAQVQQAGTGLGNLQSVRNQADYDIRRAFAQFIARSRVQLAEQVIKVFDAAAFEPTRTQIRDAMRIYERDVLKDVTWHP